VCQQKCHYLSFMVNTGSSVLKFQLAMDIINDTLITVMMMMMMMSLCLCVFVSHTLCLNCLTIMLLCIKRLYNLVMRIIFKTERVQKTADSHGLSRCSSWPKLSLH